MRITFFDEIKTKKFEYENLEDLRNKIMNGKSQEIILDVEGVLILKGRIFVPRVDDLIKKIFIELHGLRYSIHSGVTKIYRDLKKIYR